ncbi:MAG: phosphate ABC transporter permease PstA [Proteobacteria bacterium]|nr:phosphate ABC transporter permease PstA [Pseudomonadota bacterium]NOG60524.1 phosphate ABC transporter permease PstA [Pseudomonadota bacterium]
MKKWFDSGTPFVWLNAGAVSVSVIMVAGLIALIAVRGLGHFWPADVAVFDYYVEPNGEAVRLMGEIVDEETVSRSRAGNPDYAGESITRDLIKTGNRDVSGLDFRWILNAGIKNRTYPDDAMIVERREWGNFYGYLSGLEIDGQKLSYNDESWNSFQQAIENNNRIFDEIRHIEKDLIGAVNYKMERLRLKQRGLELKEKDTPENIAKLIKQREALQLEYNSYTTELEELYGELNRSSFSAKTANGKEITVGFSKVVRAYRPNAMNLLDKCFFYVEKFWEFLSDDPREANTEGGIFPAIFGTVLMVMIMAVLVTPFGVIAAVYLREYATQGPVTRLIRIAVNNLAGVPSVVYGVFGLGFFVYFLGGSIDEIFFPESLPAPTFGTPGLLWASLTLAILTVPVVIVATEEGLSRVPRAIREGSLALGATKAETMFRTVLPMTASAMMTGLILAVARAAGEVAPLMLVGVVKLAPSLGLDGNAPFLHLDRKFMHLGFHIYDVGFQSPNVEAARPLVYATALLLVLLIIILNLTAIRIRNNLREKYRAAEQS